MILFTGGGKAGSWKIRGEQLGGAIGTVKPRATLEDMRDADLVVLVKRPAPGQIEALQRSGKPWVWDLVDFYPQPECTGWSRKKAIGWVRDALRRAKPQGVVYPTCRMLDDCHQYGKNAVVYHHHRPAIRHNPIRDRIQKVGYEGEATYLGDWGEAVEHECRRRGLEFVINPQELADCDVVVAFRGEHVNGYAQRHWKSNVKLANAHGSGTPFIGGQEIGYLETKTMDEFFCESPHELRYLLDLLEPRATRLEIQHKFLRYAYPLEKAAADMQRFLNEV